MNNQQISNSNDKSVVHIWEKVEIVLEAEGTYSNPYTEVEVWVDLKGPGFAKRVYGFWDGGNIFKIRIVATAPGEWQWESGSNKSDRGLNGKSGIFLAIEWDEKEKEENSCRRGFIYPTSNGHAFMYADGTPFLLLGDTWWATPTYRYRWYEDDFLHPIGLLKWHGGILVRFGRDIMIGQYHMHVISNMYLPGIKLITVY